jgi:hypothetical protein
MGSFCALTISLAFPCLCYATLFRDELSLLDLAFNVLLGVVGILGAVYGTVVPPSPHFPWTLSWYRGTSLIRKRPPPRPHIGP